MRRYLLILLSLLLARDIATAGERQALVGKEDEEIIKNLYILEHYDFLREMDLYVDMDKVNMKDSTEQTSKEDKEKRGKK